METDANIFNTAKAQTQLKMPTNVRKAPNVDNIPPLVAKYQSWINQLGQMRKPNMPTAQPNANTGNNIPRQ